MANHKERRYTPYRYCPFCSSKKIGISEKRKFLKFNTYLYCYHCENTIIIKKVEE